MSRNPHKDGVSSLEQQVYHAYPSLGELIVCQNGYPTARVCARAPLAFPRLLVWTCPQGDRVTLEGRVTNRRIPVSPPSEALLGVSLCVFQVATFPHTCVRTPGSLATMVLLLHGILATATAPPAIALATVVEEVVTVATRTGGVLTTMPGGTMVAGALTAGELVTRSRPCHVTSAAGLTVGTSSRDGEQCCCYC